MRREHYILKDGKVVAAGLMEWAHWFETHHKERIVKQETIGDYYISTVFLGLDHGWRNDGPPVLWETLVFGKGPLVDEMTRCPGNREQAEAMHERMCARVRKSVDSLSSP